MLNVYWGPRMSIEVKMICGAWIQLVRAGIEFFKERHCLWMSLAFHLSTAMADRCLAVLLLMAPLCRKPNLEIEIGTTLMSKLRRMHAQLLSLGVETYGRWGNQSLALVRQLARYKSLNVPEVLRTSAEVGYYKRWWSILSVSVQKIVMEGIL